jgi:hypothetical protein
MKNVSTLLSQARACGHGDTFSSARRPRTGAGGVPLADLGNLRDSNVDGGYRVSEINTPTYAIDRSSLTRLTHSPSTSRLP